MRCTHCGLPLPSTLLLMRCPHCQTVVLELDKPSRSGKRGIEKQEIKTTARKRALPNFLLPSKATDPAHEPPATKTGHTAGLPLQSRGPELTFADVLGYFRTKSSRILVALCLLQLLLFCCLTWWVHFHPSWFIDVRITHEVQRPQGIVGETMKLVSMLGNVPNLFRAIVGLTAVLFWVFRHRLEAVSILLVFELSVHLNPLVKLFVNRPRPTATTVRVLEAAGGASFPSGHVMSYVAFWGLLFMLGACVFKRKSWWQRAILLLSALFVVLVGPSRVYVGAHWATDVLGAYLLEGALICFALLLYLKAKALLPEIPVWWKSGRGMWTRNRC
jgi:membrane-associated phospholipid phosphatase